MPTSSNINLDSSAYATFVAAYVNLQERMPPVTEAIERISKPSLNWFDFPFMVNGDQHMVTLLEMYPEQAWKDALTPYVVNSVSALLDDQNESRTLFRMYRILSKLGPIWRNTGLSDNPLFNRWQSIAKGDIEAETIIDKWVQLLLQRNSTGQFIDRLFLMSQDPDFTLQETSELVRYVCRRLRPLQSTHYDKPKYEHFAKLLSLNALRGEAEFNAIDDTNMAEHIDYMLRDSSNNEFMRWFCFGLINPSSYQYAGSFMRNATPRFDGYIRQYFPWFEQKGDVVLAVYKNEAEDSIRQWGVCHQYPWIEGWLQAMARNYVEAGLDVPVQSLEALMNNKSVLWWCKPAWEKSAQLIDDLGISTIDAINYLEQIVPAYEKSAHGADSELPGNCL